MAFYAESHQSFNSNTFVLSLGIPNPISFGTLTLDSWHIIKSLSQSMFSLVNAHFMAAYELQVWQTHPVKGSPWPEELEPWATWDICQIWLVHGLRPQGNYVDTHCSRESLTPFFFL